MTRLFAFILIVATPQASLADAWPAGFPLTSNGIGPARIGMARDGIEAALGRELREGWKDDPACYYVWPDEQQALASDQPDSWPTVSLMISNGRLARIDITVSSIRTQDGLGIGDPESSVHERHRGRVRVELDPYVLPYGAGKNLIVSHEGNDTGMLFEIEDGVIRGLRAGRFPELEYVEHCL